MARDVFGLSHLIFACPDHKFEWALREESAFSGWKTTIVEDKEVKRGMLRAAADHQRTEMTVFKPSNPDWPAFELIKSFGEQSVPFDRGLLCAREAFEQTDLIDEKNVAPMEKRLVEILGADTSVYNPDLDAALVDSPLLGKHHCSAGMWFHTTHLGAVATFMTDVLESRLVEAFDGGAAFLTNVATLRRPDFLIIVLDKQMGAVKHYYDDFDLAGAGWIVKNLDLVRGKMKGHERFTVSPECALATKQSKMRVFFAYDNQAPAFEFIKLER